MCAAQQNGHPTTPEAVRLKARQGLLAGPTAGLAPGYVQANLVAVSRDWAEEFLAFCRANPQPCPLVAVSEPGSPALPGLGRDIDIRRDVPLYRVWRDGVLAEERREIADLWRDDMVSFLIGCSFSFENALLREGIGVRHIEMGVNVPMYATGIQTVPAGRFGGRLVVSMRPLAPADAERAAEITGCLPQVHGAPIHVGDPAAIGIGDLGAPDFGNAVEIRAGEVPVFWACGVTPQMALANARPPLAITHSPGCMLVTDVPDSDLLSGRFQPLIGFGDH